MTRVAGQRDVRGVGPRAERHAGGGDAREGAGRALHRRRGRRLLGRLGGR